MWRCEYCESVNHGDKCRTCGANPPQDSLIVNGISAEQWQQAKTKWNFKVVSPGMPARDWNRYLIEILNP